jgi:hypothetical protein
MTDAEVADPEAAVVPPVAIAVGDDHIFGLLLVRRLYERRGFPYLYCGRRRGFGVPSGTFLKSGDCL